MRYASICSGVGSCALALKSLGYECAFFAEIEAFPSAVLSHHWPDVPNLGDFTEVDPYEWTQKKCRSRRSIQLVIGGTPCQSYSVAGQQEGMDDERGSLALEHVRLARALGATWFVWENVPGALSTNGGRDFARILDKLVECGYGWAYRVLDAQYFGVAQRRRRIFLVGYLGDWRPPAAVLFEPKGMSGDPAPLRESREGIAATLTASLGRGRGAGACIGALTPSNISTGGITAGNNPGASHVVVAKTLTTRQNRHDASADNLVCAWDSGQVTSPTNRSNPQPGGPCHTLNATHAPSIAGASAVRRLTPLECERLMGMPDNHTLVPYRGGMAKDTPRYKAIGNGFAVPVVRWIGERIKQVEELL